MVFITQLQADQNYQISPPASWIEVSDYDLNSAQSPQNVSDTRYILYDRQTNALDGISRYYHLALQVLNETSVEENGQHFFNFAPSYENLTFHQFNIIRDGKKINQLNPDQIKILHRETEAEGLMYTGELTASFILEDLRPGDIVDYSYTVTGQNPALKNNFYEYIDIQWATPLEYLSYALLWPKDEALYINKANTDIELAESNQQEHKRITLRLEHSVPLTIDSQTPYNYNPRARVSLSNNNQWSDIVDWALPLYALEKDPILLDPIIKEIKENHTSLKEQVSAALHYVQDNIRYLGLELGNHSLVPAKIASTLDKRYGDCKGKTLLLLNLLDRLNIESYPAVVNNNYITTFNEDGVRIGAFNHVLVTAFVDGKQYWLDPTINNQETHLDRLYQPDYGQALVIKPGQKQLVMMNSDNSATLKQVKEVIDLSQGVEHDGFYSINSTLIGYEAEYFRREIESNTQEEISKQYLNYYNYYYPNLSMSEPLSIAYQDDAYQVRESYTLPTPWQLNENQYEVSFYANTISSFLNTPKTTLRTSPYRLTHPVKLEQSIEVKLHKDIWDLSDETLEINNPYFSFSRTIKYDDNSNTLLLDYRYETFKNSVPLADFKDYMEDLNRASDLTGYGLYWRENTPVVAEPDYIPYFFAGFYVLTLVLIIIAIVLLIREKPPADDKAIFYPVDPTKFLVLSLLTLGIFPLYWMYKNWQYIKEQEQSAIMPKARAIFSLIWFYPLAKRILLIGKEKLTFREKAVIIALFILYILGFLLTYSKSIFILLGLAVEILCTLYLVLKINLHNPVRSNSYVHNSKWRVRHVIAGLPLSFFLVFYIASTISFIPNSQVVDGNQIWDKDLKFMYRAKILEPGERLGLFYSSDLISYEKDGNGLTDRKVFSYWKTEDGNIVKEYAYFDDIKDVTVDTQTSTLTDSSVTVTREDGSNFVLYLSKEGFGDRRFIRELKQNVF